MSQTKRVDQITLHNHNLIAKIMYKQHTNVIIPYYLLYIKTVSTTNSSTIVILCKLPVFRYYFDRQQSNACVVVVRHGVACYLGRCVFALNVMRFSPCTPQRKVSAV